MIVTMHMYDTFCNKKDKTIIIIIIIMCLFYFFFYKLFMRLNKLKST